jgi:hypothetical protein
MAKRKFEDIEGIETTPDGGAGESTAPIEAGEVRELYCFEARQAKLSVLIAPGRYVRFAGHQYNTADKNEAALLKKVNGVQLVDIATIDAAGKILDTGKETDAALPWAVVPLDKANDPPRHRKKFSRRGQAEAYLDSEGIGASHHVIYRG